MPCLFAVDQDATGRAQGQGARLCARDRRHARGVIETTFAEETETDLFGEQAVLCGGATELVVTGFETLVEAGYKPEVAYFECLHELKLIVDLMYEGGLAKMHQFVERDGQVRRPDARPARHRRPRQGAMRKMLAEIRAGQFAREWIAENAAASRATASCWSAISTSRSSEVGKKLRARMAWLQAAAAAA